MKHEDILMILQKKFPGISFKMVRESILLEDASKLPEVAAFLRDDAQLQTDFLSSVTAVDYLKFFEVVYHFYSTTRKETGVTVLRVRVGRENPEVPSLTPLFKAADFQERQCYDLFGIKFKDHPDLRRIFMWEGFEGFPLRKDYVQEDSEVLEMEDILWLEKRGIEVEAETRQNAERLAVDGKRAVSSGPTEKPGV